MRKLIIIFAAFIFACGGSDIPDYVKDAANSSEGRISISTDTTQRTPAGGTTVFSKEGIPNEGLKRIDRGIASAIQTAIESGFDKRLDPSWYQIYIVPYDCVPSPISRVPSFVLRSDSYDGTDFDQFNPKGFGIKDGRGVIHAAEYIVNLGTPISTPPVGIMYICSDLAEMENSARYGAEHILIANNDPDYFLKTWFHGNGVSHPLLPKRELKLANSEIEVEFKKPIERMKPSDPVE